MTFKTLLKQKLIKQNDLANLIKVSQPCISKWCCNKTTPPLDIMQKLAKALNVDLITIVNCFVKEKKEKDQQN